MLLVLDLIGPLLVSPAVKHSIRLEGIGLVSVEIISWVSAWVVLAESVVNVLVLCAFCFVMSSSQLDVSCIVCCCVCAVVCSPAVYL